jgi:hypothetical protein
VRFALAGSCAVVLAFGALVAGCGGSGDRQEYAPSDVEQAFASAGLSLRRLPSVGAEQPAMGETSECGTRYLARSAGGLLSVSVCDRAGAAANVAAGDRMRRANVVVEYAGDDHRVHARIERALDALEE